MAKKSEQVKAQPKQVSVIERRLQAPSVYGDGSVQVKLKDPGWTARVINTQVRPGRYHDVVSNKGWVPVLPEDLDGVAEDYGFDIRDGRVVRGERGTEVLMKMPTVYVEQIALRKAAENSARIRPSKLKQDVLDQAAGQYSDQAADYLDRAVTIKSERGPVPLEEVDSEAAKA